MYGKKAEKRNDNKKFLGHTHESSPTKVFESNITYFVLLFIEPVLQIHYFSEADTDPTFSVFVFFLRITYIGIWQQLCSEIGSGTLSFVVYNCNSTI